MPTARKLNITSQQLRALKMMAQGAPTEKIVADCFDCTKPNGEKDEKKAKKATAEIRAWKRNPIFQNAYKELIKEIIEPDIIKAIKTRSELLGDHNPWVRLQAANAILTQYGGDLVGAKQEENEVTIRITGMPSLGTPGPTVVEDADVVEEAD